MTDTWAAFNPQAPAADEWAAFNPQAPAPAREMPFPAIDINRASPFVVSPAEEGFAATVPDAFLDRVRRGQALTRILSEAAKGGKEGFGDQRLGLSWDTIHQLQDLGIFHDPARGPGSPLQMLSEGATETFAPAIDALFRGVNAGLHGGAGLIGQIVDEMGGNGESVRKEAINFGNFAMIEGGMGRFSRMKTPLENEITRLKAQTFPVEAALDRAAVEEQSIGGLPTPDDFKAAADIITERAAPARITVPVGGRLPKQPLPGEHIAVETAPDGVSTYKVTGDSGDVASARVRIIPHEGAAAVTLAEVGEPFRRQGVATRLYDQIAADMGERGLKLRPDDFMTNDAYAFWQARDPQAVIGYLPTRDGKGWMPSMGLTLQRATRTTEAAPAAETVAGKAEPAPYIEAHHGTPHDFERFDISKIGTGEGAQAYGHGLYFAENVKVAESYQTAGVRGVSPTKYQAIEAIKDHGSRQQAIAELQKEIDTGNPYIGGVVSRQAVVDLLKSNEPLEPNIYSVRINADPAHFLDWDKRLSEQSPVVQEALKKFEFNTQYHASIEPPPTMEETFKQLNGSEAVQRLTDKFGEEGATRVLLEAGIPGIKYLDQGSRDVGTGTRNFVVFDDKHVQITHKNGEPIVENNLRTMWEERGLHPAEVLHDAESDAFLRGEISPPTIGTMDRVRELTAKGMMGAEKLGLTDPDVAWMLPFEAAKTMDAFGLGADVTRDMPPLAEQPPPRRGTLVEAGRKAVDQFFGFTRNIQYLLDPMATGSKRSMVMAKDAMNSVRRIRWEWWRQDDDILRNLTLEQQERLWNALDEQSVMEQRGEVSTPAVAPGLTRIYRGEGGTAHGLRGQPAQAGSATTGGWFSTDLAKARRYGDVGYVDVSRDDLRHFAQGHGGPDELVTTNPVFRQRMRPFIEGPGAAEHMGLATLEPAERAHVERLMADSQAAWLQAVDEGLVEGEGLPAYTPRMVLNVATAMNEVGPRSLTEIGRNVFTRTSQMLHRKHLMAEDTEAAAREVVANRMRERGATEEEIAAATEQVKIYRNIRSLPLATSRLQEAVIWRRMINQIAEVGRSTGSELVRVGDKPPGWFTIDHPAFTRWEPRFERNPVTGGVTTVTNDAGEVIFDRKPIYMAPEFRGPMKAILDPGLDKVDPNGPTLYQAAMAVKGRAMLAILNSPLIHNAVVWSKVMEAAGGREWLGFGLYFRGNRLVYGNPTRARELIDRGLNPMGPRGSFQDLSSIAEEPNLEPGRGILAKGAGMVGDLFDPAAGDAARRAIDRAGDFWHNTLLWDRVRDLQFGLADHLSDHLVAKGADRITADRVAADFSNIIVGSLPKEQMSAGARALANVMLFSRSFTLGNLSTYFRAVEGLPKPLLAQIERDHGFPAGAPSEALTAPAAEAIAKIDKSVQAIARRKAIATIALSYAIFEVGNSVLQNAINIVSDDSTVPQELQGYARRYRDLMEDASEKPSELFHTIARLSATYDNEPSRQNRLRIGYDKDGTAVYVRNPAGKYGEEVIGYPTQPMTMLRQKLSPTVGSFLDILTNDKGFGRKIYDENDSVIKVARDVAKHVILKHMPEQQLQGLHDLVMGDGDRKVAAWRSFGPIVGLTPSVGAPGGMARGEQLTVKSAAETRFNLEWPDIRRQIQRGEVDEARDRLLGLGLDPRRQIPGLIRNAADPSGALRGGTIQDFYRKASPEQQRRFDRARESAP